MDTFFHSLALSAHRCKTKCLTAERIFKFLIVLLLLLAVVYQRIKEADWALLTKAPYLHYPDLSITWDDLKYILLTVVLIVVTIILRKANGECNLGEQVEEDRIKQE